MAMMESFLVKLGFSVDQASSKHFKDTMEHGVKQVNEFRLALLGLAIGVEESVRRTMRSFTQLHQTSVLTGAPVKALSDLQYGFEEIGISAGQTQGQVTRLSETLRTAGWGEHLRGLLTGPVKDGSEALKDLVKQYHDALVAGGGEEGTGSLANTLRIQFEKIQGLDFETMVRAPAKNFELWSEGMETRAKVARQFYGDNADAEQKAAENAQKATSAWNRFALTIGTGIGKIVSDNFESIEAMFQALSDWLTDPAIIKAFGDIFASLTAFFKDEGNRKAFIDDLELVKVVILALVDAVGWLIAKFKWLCKEVGPGWALGIAAAMWLLIPSILSGFTTLLFAPLVGMATTAGAAVGAAFIAAFPVLAVAAAITAAVLLGWKNARAQTAEEESKDEFSGNYGRNPAEIRKEREHYKKDPMLWQRIFGQPAEGEGGEKLYQHGGIVRAGLHEGEMVLPANISMGLQQLFSRPASFGGGGLAEEFKNWWSGDASFRPFVDMLPDFYEKLQEVLMYVADQTLKAMGYTEGVYGGATGATNNAPGGAGTGAGSATGAGAGAEPRTGVAGAGRMPGRVEPSGPDTVVPGPGGGVINRQKYIDELNANPALREKILRIAANEQGRNPEGTQAVLESMMNRAAVRGTTLERQARWYKGEQGGYYAMGSLGRGALENAQSRRVLEQSLANTLAGGNISNYATDNASGSLAARERASGAFKYASKYTGETFFTPGTNEPGQVKRYDAWRASLGNAAATSPTVTSPTVTPTQIAATVAAVSKTTNEFARRRGEPLGARGRGGPTTVNHNTNIHVHGAHDPRSTAQHVAQLQQRSRIRNIRPIVT